MRSLLTALSSCWGAVGKLLHSVVEQPLGNRRGRSLGPSSISAYENSPTWTSFGPFTGRTTSSSASAFHDFQRLKQGTQSCDGRVVKITRAVLDVRGLRVCPVPRGHAYLKVSLIFSPACLRLPLA